MARPVKGQGCRAGGAVLAAGVFIALSSSGAAAQFFATQTAGGDLEIVDAAGVEIEVVASDPVGERPSLCPASAYHVAEVPDDASQLVLSDCATGEGQFTVEIRDGN